MPGLLTRPVPVARWRGRIEVRGLVGWLSGRLQPPAKCCSKMARPNSPHISGQLGGALVHASFMHRSCIFGGKASWTLGAMSTAEGTFRSLWTMEQRKTGFFNGCLLCPIPFLVHASFMLPVAAYGPTSSIF